MFAVFALYSKISARPRIIEVSSRQPILGTRLCRPRWQLSDPFGAAGSLSPRIHHLAGRIRKSAAPTFPTKEGSAQAYEVQCRCSADFLFSWPGDAESGTHAELKQSGVAGAYWCCSPCGLRHAIHLHAATLCSLAGYTLQGLARQWGRGTVHTIPHNLEKRL